MRYNNLVSLDLRVFYTRLFKSTKSRSFDRGPHGVACSGSRCPAAGNQHWLTSSMKNWKVKYWPIYSNPNEETYNYKGFSTMIFLVNYTTYD